MMFPPELGKEQAKQNGWKEETAKEELWPRRHTKPIQPPSPPSGGGGESEEGEGEKGEGPGEGGGEGGEGDKEAPAPGQGKTPEQIHKEIEEKLGKKSDNAKQEAEAKAKEGNKPAPGGNQGVNQVSSTTDNDWAEVTTKPKPKFGWKEIIRQFVTTSKEFESTYAKMHKRTITAMTNVAATGSGAIKPGQRPVEDAYKLAIMFDSTGSMLSRMPTSLAETEKMISDHYGSIAGIMGIGMYGTNNPAYFALSLEKKKFWSIATMKDLGKKAPPATMPMSQLFSMRTGGGNELPANGAAEIKGLLSQGFNVVFITDRDILAQHNWVNLVDIYGSYKKNFFLILNDKESFEMVCQKLGSTPGTFTHFAD